MRWNKTPQGYTTSHVSDEDVQRLQSLALSHSWADCMAFLRNRLSAYLFPETIDQAQLFTEIVSGEFGEIEGACTAYESRRFDGNLISTN